jgi:NAD(P)-dependent dehydrogenase (short-subunit alcohol dehydrogenase family)
LIARIVSTVGSARVAALVNNAAVQLLGKVSELTVEAWLQTLDTNVSAPFVLTKALHNLLRIGHGSVVNISSVHARATKSGFVAYSTSKAALSGLTRGLAIDFGPEIPVFGIEPGAVATPMLRAGFEGDPDGWRQLNYYQPLGRIACPEELADLVHYLISNRPLVLSGAMLEAGGAIGSRLHDPA